MKYIVSRKAFVPHLEMFDESVGIIGEEADFTAMSGEKLHVGDIVTLYDSKRQGPFGYSFICKKTEYGFFVMGLASKRFCFGVCENWQIRKVRSHKDLIHGETNGGVSAVLK